MDVKTIESAYRRIVNIRERSGPEKFFLHIHIGKPGIELVALHRKNIHPQSFLLYFYPETEGVDIDDLYSHFTPDERILFSSLDRGETHIEILSMSIALLKIEPGRIAVTQNAELEKVMVDKIERIKNSVNDFLSNLLCESRSSLMHLRCSIHNLPLIMSNGIYSIKGNGKMPHAIICGAGPSLLKQFDILKKYKGKILIIASGHAYAALHNAGIEPDFVVEMDSESHLNWRRHNIKPACPLVAMPILAPETARRFEKIIWASEPHSSFSGFLREAGINLEPLSLSRSVIITAIDFAVKAACPGIALIGNDLCMSESGNAHVKASVFDDEEPQTLIEIEGNEGEKVFTVPGFEGIREVLQAYLLSVKQQKNAPEIFNCTEGGAHIENCGRLSLRSFVESASPASCDLSFPEKEIKNTVPYITGVRDDFAEYLNVLERLLSLSRQLSSALNNPAAETSQIASLRTELKETARHETEIKNRKTLKDLITVAAEQADAILSRGGTNSTREAAVMLEEFEKRHELIHDLCNDIKSDFDFILDENIKNEGPYSFKSFRKFTLSFIEKNNKEFADFLHAHDKQLPERFKLLTNQLYLPFVRIEREDKSLFRLNSFISMESSAAAEVNDFIKESGFDIKRNAVVFFAPGNWAHVVEFAKMYPDADFLVVDPWPELFSAIINQASFMHYLPEKTLMIGMRDDLKNWKRIYHGAVREWKRQGREILFFRHPRTWQLAEIQEKLKELPS